MPVLVRPSVKLNVEVFASLLGMQLQCKDMPDYLKLSTVGLVEISFSDAIDSEMQKRQARLELPVNAFT